jgi:hypothetical protein
MKRVLWIFLGVLLGLQLAAPARAGRRVVVHRAPRHRTVVVVERGWPLHRPLREVVVHPARVAVRVRPTAYLAPLVFAGVLVATAPPRDVLVWEDGETIDRNEGWSEFTLNCDSRGRQLYFEVASGRMHFDWIEVVF